MNTTLTPTERLTPERIRQLLAGADLLSGGETWPAFLRLAESRLPEVALTSLPVDAIDSLLIVALRPQRTEAESWVDALKTALAPGTAWGPTLRRPHCVMPACLTAPDVLGAVTAAGALGLPLADLASWQSLRPHAGQAPVLLLYEQGKSIYFNDTGTGNHDVPADYLASRHAAAWVCSDNARHQAQDGLLSHVLTYGECLSSGPRTLAALTAIEPGNSDAQIGTVRYVVRERPSGGMVIIRTAIPDTLELEYSAVGIRVRLNGTAWASPGTHAVALLNAADGRPLTLSDLHFGQVVCVVKLPKRFHTLAASPADGHVEGRANGNA